MKANKVVYGVNKETAPQIDKDFFIRFIPVKGGEGRRRVIRIHVNHYPGGVFETAPEAYHITDDGQYEKLSLSEVFSRIYNTDSYQQDVYPFFTAH